MESTNNLRKRLYQNLLNKEPKQNHLLGSTTNSKSAILKPRVVQDLMNTTAKISSPVFQRGKIKMQIQMRSPQISKKIAPLINKDNLSKQGKAIIEEGKLKSKANLKPHDIFAFYESFPEMSEDFFYLNRVGHPYDYQIVTYSQRNPMEYMTISFKGVTLYHEKQAEFITKDEWLEDEKIYYSLQKIEFFKQYKISKNFTIWKNKMRRHYMKEMSNLLNEGLFFSYEHPRHCLLEVRKVTNHLKESAYFMPSNSMESEDPEHFKKNAEEYIQKKFMRKVKEIENMVVEQLEIAINQEIKKFKLQNNIKINDVGDHDKKDHKEGYVYSQQAILRKEYKKVNKLIKLADNIILESKIQLFHNCLVQLIEKIEEVRSSDSKSEWIKCIARLIENDGIKSRSESVIEWNPTLEGLKAIFKELINLAIVKISEEHEKISMHQKFQKYRVNQENDNRKDEKRNTLKYLIQDSFFYVPLIKKIERYLEEEFLKTKKEEEELLKFIAIYQKHKQLPDIKEIFRVHSASEYMQLVREWRQDDVDMHMLPVNKSGGLLIFDYSLLRSTMHEVPKKTLNAFLAQLPQQTKKKYKELVNQSENYLQHINNYPVNMEGFVEFNKAVKMASTALDQLIDGSKALIQMVALIEENKSPNHDFNKINPKKAIQNINKLKAKVDQSNAKYDQSLSHFKKGLESRITKVQTSVKELSSKFQIIPFDNTASHFTTVLQRLQEIFPCVSKLEQEAQNIHQIQYQLSLSLTNMNEIHDLYKKCIHVKNLWQCQQKWIQLRLQIQNKHYKEINCKELKSKWEEFSRKNSQLQKSLPDNQVLKNLIIDVSHFENLLETITALTSPNLEEKSWRQISEYLAYELGVQNQKQFPFSNQNDPIYTVKWFSDKQISVYKEKISFIVQKSEKERQLQANFGEFKTFISTIKFEPISRKREVIFIERNEALQKNINQKISILYSLIGNQYSDALKNDAELLIKHYEYMQEILENIYTFKQDWQKYEPFFESNAASAKLLSKESKEFSSWQLQWKKIVKSIINDPAYFYKKICDQTLGVNCSRAIIKSMNKTNMFLDMIKKGIEQFLEKKRLQFPRYCLFTDEQLLKILSKVDVRQLIVPELIPILYDNIKSIEYSEDAGSIVSVTVTGYDNHKFVQVKPSAFKSQSEMEDLLKTTEEQIGKTMASVVKLTFNKYIEEEISRESLIKDNNLQVALLVDYIAWVRLAEETYLVNEPVGSMKDWLHIQEQQIQEVSQMLKTCTPHQYFKYLQFMVQSIYFREKTISLVKQNIAQTSFYEWQRIPKMIMTSNSQVYLRQLDSKVPYNYELLNQKDLVVIQSETERVWINLINAIAAKDGRNVIGLNGKNIQAVKDLAFYLGQSVKSVKISENCNIKTVERLLTGYMFIGCWMHFMPIKNQQILSYITYHISSQKRSNNFESTSSALQLTKSNSLSTSFSNTVFLFEAGEQLVQYNLVDSKNFRNITLAKPEEKYIMTILCQAEKIPKQVGQSIVNICDFCRDTFEFRNAITHELERIILKQIKETILPKLSESELNDSQVIDYIVLNMIEQSLSVYFTQGDRQIYQSFKLSMSNNLALASKLKQKLSKKIETLTDTHPVIRYIKAFLNDNQPTYQFKNQAVKIYDMLNNKSKFGIILSGQILCGKSEMISFLQKVHRFAQKLTSQFKVSKIYPNAYKTNDLLKVNSQEKKEKKQKTDKTEKSEKQKIEKVNEEIGIFQNFLRQDSTQKWIVLDGKIPKQLFEFASSTFDNLIVPNYGLISKEKNHKQGLQKVKIIIETLNSSEFSPSIFYNYSVTHISPSTCTVQTLVHSFFLNEKIRKYLRSLTQESIQLFETTLVSNLQKVELKGNIKSKSLDFLYPLAENEITIKSLKMIECIFNLNQESIREKEKNMKKTIQKFVNWVILMVLYLHVQVQNRQKLEKKYMQVCKCENIFEKSVINNIVYPSSGIEVHPVNGLRTQSSLLEIPERGIMTLNTKIDFNDFNNFMNQKNNKFYEEINLECISSIRVNHDESNLFNYYSQLFSYSNQPLVLTGPVGTGKKSILELYAKNIRNKAVVHSIRHHHNRSLMEVFEKPYRRYNSLDGVILKSVSVTKNIVVFVEDLNLTIEENQSLEFLRMLTNDNMFINKNGQSRKLTQQNNSLCILTNRINIDEQVLRVASRLMFFQTTNNSGQKITSIFSPYLKAWSKANNLIPEVERIFNSPNHDTLLDATIKVMESMEEAFKQKKSEGKYSLDTILLRPRIGDISKVLSCICMTQEANTLSVGYYAELWANEIMRVFQDRLSPSQKDISHSLIELIKKEFFLKFKQNFHFKSNELFIFSSYLSPEQNRFYQKIYNLEHLQEMIGNAYDSQEITVPVKLFFSELLKEIMKVYRVLEISNGHMVLLHLNKKVRQYLIELASQVAKTPLIQLKQNILSVEKDIMGILEYESDVSVFEDIDDITEDQIYQFTCLLNKNFYDYDMKAETRQRVKNKVSKYIKQMLNDISAVRETISQSQKSKQDGLKEKQNSYLNQKIEEELQSTMQEIMMNSVHFMFGASPLNEKTRKFFLNETDLIGEMHFSFFNLPEESLVQISKDILSMEEQEELRTQQQIANPIKETAKQKSETTKRIQQKCLKIYNSLPEHYRSYNDLLCMCQNILTQKQRLQKESHQKIDQLSRTIENYYKAQKLITQNEQKLTELLKEIDLIKGEQSVLKQKMEDKDNEINELRLSVTENGDGSEEDEQKKLIIETKKEQLELIENELREIKMKRDKNDSKTKLSKKIIQISKAYIDLIANVDVIEHELNQEKTIQSSIQNLLALWWSVVLFSSNKNTQQLIDDLNAWMKAIEFQPTHPVETPDDVISTFELVISPIGAGLTTWESISPEIKLKGVILIYTLMHHDDTTSANRIITLYDPSKIYTSLFGYYLSSDSELGNYHKATVIHKYDTNFWPEMEKHRKGLIFFEETIESREKKQIEAHIIKGRIIQLNRIVSLVNKREKADISFMLQKNHFINQLKFASLKAFEPIRAIQLTQHREDYTKESRKLRELIHKFKTKRQQMRFDMQGDTEELSKMKTQIQLLDTKVMMEKCQLKLSDMEVKDDLLINKIVDELFMIEDMNWGESVRNKQMMVLKNVEKLYFIVKQKVMRFVSQLRDDSPVCVKKNSSMSGKQSIQCENPSNKIIQLQQNISQPKLQAFQHSLQEQQQINEFIHIILQNNCSSSQKVYGQELFSLNLLSLELQQKVPIIVVENNLLNYSFFNKENRPINLLYNVLSNVSLQSMTAIGEDNNTVNNKTLLFYNDTVHFNVLMEFINKYQEDYKSQAKEQGKTQKKHSIYLFTNSPLPLLNKHQYLPTSCYKLFFYQRTQTASMNSRLISCHQMNQKSTKTQLFIRLTEFLSKTKFYNNLAEVERYTELLSNKNWPHIDSVEETEKLQKAELKKYLLDITCTMPNHEELLEKIFSEQISFQEINKLALSYVDSERLNEKSRNLQTQNQLNFSHFVVVQNFNKMILDEVQDELPYLFNTSDFMNPTIKDSLSTEIEAFAYIYNRKIKKIKHLLLKNLKEYTLVLNKLPSKYLYTMPTESYIKELNKEYKTIKKLLTQNGMLIGPSPSMGKIVSSKGLGIGLNSEPTLLAKNCMCLEDMFFNKRIINQLKIRAAKKLKIPFNRVRILFALERKSQNIIYPNCVEKIINNSTLDITLAVSATLVSGQFKDSVSISKDQKNSQQRMPIMSHAPNKSLRILIIPYDNNALQDIPSIGNLGQVIGDMLLVGGKKKSTCDATRKDENYKDKNFVEITKVKIILKHGQSFDEASGQQIGFVQIPSAEICGDNLSIVSPKLVISAIKEKNC